MEGASGFIEEAVWISFDVVLLKELVGSCLTSGGMLTQGALVVLVLRRGSPSPCAGEYPGGEVSTFTGLVIMGQCCSTRAAFSSRKPP